MQRLGIGLIGCGWISQGAHVPALSRLTALARVVHACDVRPEAAEQTARLTGADKWSVDYREVLDNRVVDAVIITTPEFLHMEQTVAAAQAGKHVLCEKPIAASLDEADAMIAAAASAGVRLMIAHSRRFTARYMTVRRLLDSGAVGRPVLVRENERRPRTQYTELKVGVQPWRPEGGRSWRDLSRYSGGVVRGHAIHEMDLFRWFAGADARAVYAETKITVPGREVPDAVSIHVEFENGVLGACDLYSQAPADYPYYHQLELVGTEGILRACDRDMITLTAYDGHGMRYPAAYESLLHITDAYAREQRLFFEAIADDRPVPLDPRHARAALELALAATRSAETGARVDLPLAPAPAKGT